MSLFRQGGRFLVVGLAQLLLDWVVFVTFSAWGMPAAPANLCGRVAGALLGFILHGRYTFATEGGALLGGRRFLRYAVVWTALSAVSTVLVVLAMQRAGLEVAWLVKPLVEGGLAAVSFFLWRRLVFR